MQIKSKRVTHSREVKECHTVCDRCGSPCGYDEPVESSYDVKEAEISVRGSRRVTLAFGAGDDDANLRIDILRSVKVTSKDGSCYGSDGGSVDHTIIDCCVKCFQDEVLPALVALGFKPRTENLEY
jgi:hypothetical protein